MHFLIKNSVFERRQEFMPLLSPEFYFYKAFNGNYAGFKTHCSIHVFFISSQFFSGRSSAVVGNFTQRSLTTASGKKQNFLYLCSVS
jgi:hypothetical protein